MCSVVTWAQCSAVAIDEFNTVDWGSLSSSMKSVKETLELQHPLNCFDRLLELLVVLVNNPSVLAQQKHKCIDSIIVSTKNFTCLVTDWQACCQHLIHVRLTINPPFANISTTSSKLKNVPSHWKLKKWPALVTMATVSKFLLFSTSIKWSFLWSPN